MRWMRLVVLAMAVPVVSVPAQQPSRVELGTMLGVSILSGNGQTEVVAAAPGGGTLLGTLPVLYANFSVTPHVTVEPQTYFLLSDGSLLVSGSLQVGYVANPQAHTSPFVTAHGGLVYATGGDPSFMLGGSVGYRVIATDALAIRIEGRYRRWLDGDVNDFGLLIGFGVRLH